MPNVRGKPEPTVGRQAPATDNVHRTCGRGLVARRWFRLDRGVRLRRVLVDAANRSDGRLTLGLEASGLLPADSLGHRVGNPCDSFGPGLDATGGGLNTNLDAMFGCFGAAFNATGRGLGPALDSVPDFGGDRGLLLGSWRGRLTRKS